MTTTGTWRMKCCWFCGTKWSGPSHDECICPTCGKPVRCPTCNKPVKAPEGSLYLDDTTGETWMKVRHRQIARALEFPPELVPYINWDALGTLRAQLASDMEVRRAEHGPDPDGLIVTLSWPAGEDA